MDCCDDLDPGELSLQPLVDGPSIHQSESALIEFDNQRCLFHDLQSWIGPGCVDDPAQDRHLDWLAVAVAP